MVHRAVIERQVNVGVDSFGQPLLSDFQVNGTFPVLAVPKTITQVVDGDKLAVIPVLELLAAAADDVLESDRVQNITDRLGVEVFAGPFKILSVEQQRQGYKRIRARSVKAG